MPRMKTLFQKNTGFTLVELIVVIVAIAILAGITILGYGTWRQSVAEANVRSDLTQLAAAMNSAKTWSNGYPVFAADTNFSSDAVAKKVFSPSDDITITYASGDAKAYCVDAISKKVPGCIFVYEC